MGPRSLAQTAESNDLDTERTEDLVYYFLIPIAVLSLLQFLPPAIRAYLLSSTPKTGKMSLFAIAFTLLTFRIFARRSVRTEEGVILTGSLRTNTLVKCVYLTGCYEPTLANFIRRTLRPGDIFVDVGANTGHFSLIAASQGAEVIAIEASPANCRLFRRNVEANAFEPKIRLVNAAAGNENGSIELFDNRFNGMWSTTVPGVFWYLKPLTRQVTIPQVALDEVLEAYDRSRIRLIKIDVEGAELKVVRGLRRLIERASEALEFCIEFSPRWLTSEQSAELFDTFRAKGYTAHTLVNPEMDFPPYEIRSPVPCRATPTSQVDLLFSRRPY